MPIYTKTGDKGQTSLFGGKRVSKDSIQVEAYGSIDELTSFLGLLMAKITTEIEQKFLLEIQADLYKIMAYLADANSPIEVIEARITLFEQKIDSMQSKLPELHSFILPSGTETSALAHIVRAVCRRAERNVITFSNSTDKNENDLFTIIKYLNRLSDLFFVLARWYNAYPSIMGSKTRLRKHNQNKEVSISLLKKSK